MIPESALLITSTANSRVRILRSLADHKHRAAHGLFLAEGVRLAEEAVAAGINPAILLFAPRQVDGIPRAQAAVAALAARSYTVVEATPEVVASASGVQHGQGVVFAVPFSELRWSSGDRAVASNAHPLRKAAPLSMVIDAVSDPGNLGTLLRTARAAGWSPLLTPGSADAYAPKAVRAGAGVHFWIGPLFQQGEQALISLCSRYHQVLLADAHGDLRYDEVDWTAPSALIVASEANGARAATRQLATGTVRIPMQGGGESLNVGAAAAILCFEAARQRQSMARPSASLDDRPHAPAGNARSTQARVAPRRGAPTGSLRRP